MVIDTRENNVYTRIIFVVYQHPPIKLLSLLILDFYPIFFNLDFYQLFYINYIILIYYIISLSNILF